MPKILWVALPLLLAATGLMVQLLLRRRSPSRHALNIWSSVLLVVYVSTTAGLGIFWVAHQQLPVFDWHYLFGYATVLLVVLHLAFNFRIVWRYLRHPHGPANGPADAAEVAQGRRLTMAGLGVLAAAGVAFVLGLRHGRSELRIQAGAVGQGAAQSHGPVPAALAVVERYHAFSSHSRTGALLRAPGAGWGDAPPAFKRYPDAMQVVALPPPRSAATAGAAAGLAPLGDVLWHTAGITDARAVTPLRASPSSGALFSTELYVAARAVAGLAPGLWHYDARRHALELLQPGPPTDLALGAPAEPLLRDAIAAVFATAVFGRTGHKYRDRTYRYVLADLGHALENLRVAALAVGLQVHFVHRFDEARAAGTLGLDEQEEGVLALLALARGPAAAADARPAPPAERWQAPMAPFDDDAPPLGTTNAVHLATSLRAAAATLAPAAPHAPAAASHAGGPSLPSGALPLPPARTSRASPAEVLDSIARRRSVRRFADRAAPSLEALARVLAGMARPAPLLSSAVHIYLVVNAVQGVAPGAWAYDSHRHALLPRRTPLELRTQARAAALDQDVIGDAAVVFVLTIERTLFAGDPAGAARGYRHAFIEAGLMGERIYLEAVPQRLGACAVGAFYDKEAAALVGVDPAREWVVHFAALGVPAV